MGQRPHLTKGTAVRAYEFLVKLYPPHYQQAFATQMLQTFADQVADKEASHEPLDATFWLNVLSDNSKAIIREHWEWKMSRTRSLSLPWTGIVVGTLTGIPTIALSALLLLTPYDTPAAHVAQYGLLSLLWGVLPLIQLFKSYRYPHPTLTARPGTHFTYAILATAAAALVSTVLITISWLPSVSSVARLDPGMIADWHRSGAISFDSFLIEDNIQAGLILAGVSLALILTSRWCGRMLRIYRTQKLW
jgi:hypothetical protein